MLGLFSLLTVALCGLLAAPGWSVIVAGLALATLSYTRHHLLFRRASDLGMQRAIDETLVGSLINGLAASAVAYGCGVGLRFLSLGSL
jgi:hypothetical protein